MYGGLGEIDQYGAEERRVRVHRSDADRRAVMRDLAHAMDRAMETSAAVAATEHDDATTAYHVVVPARPVGPPLPPLFPAGERVEKLAPEGYEKGSFHAYKLPAVRQQRKSGEIVGAQGKWGRNG